MLIKSLHELTALKEKYKTKKKMRIDVCGGTGCNASGNQQVIKALKDEIVKLNLEKEIEVVVTGCFGFCEKGPILKILPDNTFYIEIDEKKARKIVQEHLAKGQVVEEYLYREPISQTIHSRQEEIPFYQKQKRIALRNCGSIDPENIYEYIADEGYQALGKVISELKQEESINIIKQSGLRGRGGAGPAGEFRLDGGGVRGGAGRDFVHAAARADHAGHGFAPGAGGTGAGPHAGAAVRSACRAR